MDNQKTRSKYKKRKTGNTILTVIVLGAIYIFLQMYLMNNNKVDTVKAGLGYINDSIISQGIVCREEVVLTKDIDGVVDYVVEDGKRISKGYHIADVYPSYDDLDNLVYLRNREKTLESVKNVENYINGSVLDISNTRKLLSLQMTNLSRITSVENYNGTLSNLTELTESLNKIGVATGRITDFSGAIAQIQSEIDATRAKIPQPLATMNSPYTGYFLKTVDDLEKVATVENMINISYEEGMRLINSSKDKSVNRNEYGKVITDYKWSLCTYLTPEQAERLREGQNIKISLKVGSNEYHKATVEKIVEKGDKVLVVIECTTMDSTIATTRITDCEILFKQYNGIKIPKTAIKFDNEQSMGVFVNFSNVVQFKKISPTYEDENYIIVPNEFTSDNQIKLYDSIIVKGRNLYDGKYL